jgi:response regulator RpfG family c-di-GMP phosphodiesterase
LELLDVQPVELVISDNLMPQMSGVEFLNQVRTKYPDTIRIF